MIWQFWLRPLRTLVTLLILIIIMFIITTTIYLPDRISPFTNIDLLNSTLPGQDPIDPIEIPSDFPRLPGESKRLPSCIIIGARKCGTRALLEFLNLHPDIRTAKFELHFFNKDSIYKKGVNWYRNGMPFSLPHQVTMEKTPGYFINQLTPERIFRMNHTIRLLLIVREPVRRTVSDYTQVHTTKLAKGKSHEPFERIVLDEETGKIRSYYKPVKNSIYYKHMINWVKYFPLSNIQIVDGDRFVLDPLWELRKIETFLGLKHKINQSQLYYNRTKGFYCYRHPQEGAKCLGETKGRQHVNISENVRRKLEEFFAPYNRLFFNLTNRTFDWKT